MYAALLKHQPVIPESLSDLTLGEQWGESWVEVMGTQHRLPISQSVRQEIMSVGDGTRNMPTEERK